MHIDPGRIIAQIGHLPVGDPGAIEAHAARIDADAERLRTKARVVRDTVGSTPYEGPAATRFRAAIEGLDGDLTWSASQLHQLAGDMRAGAARLRSQQSAWHQAYARVEAELVAVWRATH